MRNWGPDTDVALVLFVVVAVVVAVPVAVVLRHRRGHLAPLPIIAITATALYGVAIVAATLFPVPVDQADACRHTTAGWHIVPFRTVGEAARVVRSLGVGGLLVSSTTVQVLLNVLLLLPLGAVIGWRTRRPLWVAAVTGLGVSLVIEVTQGTGLFGLYQCPYRYGEIDDLITNTAGAAIGWVIGRRIARRSSTRSDRAAAPMDGGGLTAGGAGAEAADRPAST